MGDCSLSDQQRSKGVLCRSMYCTKCPEFRKKQNPPVSVGEKFREFWVDKFNGHQPPSYQVHLEKKEPMDLKLVESPCRLIPGNEIIHVIEYEALEAERAKVKKLVDILTKDIHLLNEIINSKDKSIYEFSQIKRELERGLEAERAKVEKLSEALETYAITNKTFTEYGDVAKQALKEVGEM